MFGIFKKSNTNEAKLLIGVDSGSIVLYDPINLEHRKDSQSNFLIEYGDSTFVVGERPKNAMFPNLYKHIEIPELNNQLVSVFDMDGDGGYDIHMAVGFETIAEILPFYDKDSCPFRICNDIINVTSKQIFIGDLAYVPNGGWMPRQKQLPNGTALFPLENGKYKIHLFQLLLYTEDDIEELKEEREYNEDSIWTDEAIDKYFQLRDKLSDVLIVLEKLIP